jgi:hypothetical protein
MIEMILVVLFHIFCILSSGFILLFSNNITIIFIFSIIVALIFLQTLIYDGCILAKFEKGIPYVDNLSNILKAFTCTNIPTNDIEKILVGVTLMGYIGKLSILGFLHFVYKQSWLEFIMSSKSNFLLKFIPVF